MTIGWKPILGSIGLALVCGVDVSAGSFDIHVNDDSARARLVLPIKQTGIDMSFGWLHNSDDGDVAEAGVHLVGLTGKGNTTVEVSVGGKLMVVRTDDDDGSALALGGQVTYELPRVEGLSFGASLYFAPESVAFGDMEKVVDLEISAGYRVHERAVVYVAATSVKADFDSSRDRTIDNGLHVGFRTRF